MPEIAAACQRKQFSGGSGSEMASAQRNGSRHQRNSSVASAGANLAASSSWRNIISKWRNQRKNGGISKAGISVIG